VRRLETCVYNSTVPNREQAACNCQWENPRVSISTWNFKGMPVWFVDAYGKYKTEWQLQSSNLKWKVTGNYWHFGSNETDTDVRVQWQTEVIRTVLREMWRQKPRRWQASNGRSTTFRNLARNTWRTKKPTKQQGKNETHIYIYVCVCSGLHLHSCHCCISTSPKIPRVWRST
jgi:hypothetical protein